MSAAPDSQDRMFNHAVVEPIDAALLHEMLAFGRLHYPPGDPYTSVAYRQWLYLDNPAGVARAVLIRQRETLIGQAALVPLHLLVPGGQVRKGYFVVDVLTHPEFRNLRLFSHIIDAALDHVRGEGSLLLGHPNQAALRGWQRKEMTFQPPLRPHVLRPVLAWPRWLTKEADIMAIWPDVERSIGAANGNPEILRSIDYMRWRFLRRPDKPYSIAVGVARDGAPFAFSVTVQWRHGLALLVDHWCDGRQAIRTGRPTLALLPAGQQSVANAVRLPVAKEVPYFVTDPTCAGLRYGRLTLAASDF